MRPIFITKQSTALDRDGISLSQTPGAAGNLTITGALASGGSVTLSTGQQIVGVYSGSNIAARVFTIYGTDGSNNAISDTVTGVNNSTVSTVLNFKTVTRVAVDAGTGAAVEVGITGVSASPPIPLDQHVSPHNTALFIEILTGLTVNASVQYTFDDVFLQSNFTSATGLNWVTHPVLVGVTASTDSNLSAPPAAVRLLINSGTDPAKLIIRQAGLWG